MLFRSGIWSSRVSGEPEGAARPAAAQDEGSSLGLRQPPEPSRSWSAPRWRPGQNQPVVWNPAVSSVAVAPVAPASIPTAVSPAQSPRWSVSAAAVGGFGQAETATTAMGRALRSSDPRGLRRRSSLGRAITLVPGADAAAIEEVIEATYRQLLNRVPFAAERLGDAESQLRNGRLTVAEFVAQLAGSDLFQKRLLAMAPLRGAAAAHMALLGRAPTPAESSAFLATRSNRGQLAALDALLSSADYAGAFGRDTVPYLRLASLDGIPLPTLNRSAMLYGGNAALNPPPRGAI